MTKLIDWEKGYLYDTIKKNSKWVQVGAHTGYWEIRLWTTVGTEFDQAMIEEHNRIHKEKDENGN